MGKRETRGGGVKKLAALLWLAAWPEGATPRFSHRAPWDCSEKGHGGIKDASGRRICESAWPVGPIPRQGEYRYRLQGCPNRSIWPASHLIVNSRLIDLALRAGDEPMALFWGKPARGWPLNWTAFIIETRRELELVAHARAEDKAYRQELMEKARAATKEDLRRK